MNKNRITRVELVDWKTPAGRVFVHREEDSDISFDLQDDGRTLKVFIKKAK
jgi:hypothetical protein